MKRRLLLISLLFLFVSGVTGCQNNPVTQGSTHTSANTSLENTSGTEQQEQQARTTILQLLKTAVRPVGTTLYIWGGGWNEDDTGGGVESVTLGISPAWQEFFSSQDATYDYQAHEFEIHNGLDCSGYMGWLVYNAMETEDNQTSYVTNASEQPALFEERGLGNIQEEKAEDELLPGDIFYASDHIYMLVKAFGDGSRLIIHATVPGVQFSGTPDAQGNQDSEAARWAGRIMEEYFPDYFARYPSVYVDPSYNTYARFRFNETTVSGQKLANAIRTSELVALMLSEIKEPSESSFIRAQLADPALQTGAADTRQSDVQQPAGESDSAAPASS